MAKAAEIEVTPEMVKAGWRVLREAGVMDDPVEADKLVVVEVYRAMTAEAARHQGGTHKH